jgi:hypothetical protein
LPVGIGYLLFLPEHCNSIRAPEKWLVNEKVGAAALWQDRQVADRRVKKIAGLLAPTVFLRAGLMV